MKRKVIQNRYQTVDGLFVIFRTISGVAWMITSHGRWTGFSETECIRAWRLRG